MASTPSIEPSSFDLIVVGTGLPQCILAAAVASSGRSVLHLDPLGFYGSHWASLSLRDFSLWAASGGGNPETPSETVPSEPDSSMVLDPNLMVPLEPNSSIASEPNSSMVSDPNLTVRSEPDSSIASEPNLMMHSEPNSAIPSEPVSSVANRHPAESNTASAFPPEAAIVVPSEPDPSTPDPALPPPIESDSRQAPESAFKVVLLPGERNLYSDFRIGDFPESALGPSRAYSIDLAGPKLAFCTGPLIDLLLRSGSSHYLEFKGLEAIYAWGSQGLSPVPSSRAEVFKDRSMTPLEKRYLMRFFKLVADFTKGESGLSEEDLDGQFSDLLGRQQLPSSVQSIILYAIALAYEEQGLGTTNNGLKTKDGLNSLAIYLSSVGRFPNASGAFLYPLYGQGELPQAFSRCAAVKGALYVLRMPVDALLLDRENCTYKGVRIRSGQLLFSQKLVMGPGFIPPGFLNNLTVSGTENDNVKENGHASQFGGSIAHAICITDRSLQSGQSTIMVVFPPRSVNGQTTGVIRAVQLGSNASVCPEGKFLVYLSTLSSEGRDGIEILQAAVDTLFFRENAPINEDNVPTREPKPTLLWSVFYIRHMDHPQSTQVRLPLGNIVTCDMPDETLDYRAMAKSVEKMFETLFPEEIFFPRIDTVVPPIEESGDGESDNIMENNGNSVDSSESAAFS